jgi:hypothetical protein
MVTHSAEHAAADRNIRMLDGNVVAGARLAA